MSGWLSKGVVFVVGVFLAFLAVIIIVTGFGSSRFKREYTEEKEHVLQCAHSGPFRPAPRRAVDSLPQPVRKYLEVTGSVAKPALKLAIVKQRGMLRTAPDKPWMRFEGEQVYSFLRAEFIWMAQIRSAPLVRFMVRDRYIEGHGDMFVSLAGLKVLAEARGPEVDSSAGLRYWSEAICFPETVLDPRLRWEAMNARQARMRVRQWGKKTEAVVEFDERGLPSAVHGERYRETGGSFVLTPWSGLIGDWHVIDGRFFPTSLESVWRLPEGDFPAVRIEIAGIEAE